VVDNIVFVYVRMIQSGLGGGGPHAGSPGRRVSTAWRPPAGDQSRPYCHKLSSDDGEPRTARSQSTSVVDELGSLVACH